MNQTTLSAPVALITGAARRIGAAIAWHLHQKGFRVVIHFNHSSQEAKALALTMNKNKDNSAQALQADLTIKNACYQLVSETVHWGKRLDLLVNNASFFKRTDVSNPSEADWNKLFDTNVRAPFWLSHASKPYLAKQRGCIINITDIHAEKPLKDYTVYCQSKAALTMQTKSLAREFAPMIRVNGVAPGAISWPEGENTLSEALQKKIIAQTPLNIHGDPTFIAHAVLAIVENPFITGEILHVDGGRRLI
ncbi:pteridine reductase [Legionella oakridgensis]|uniref:Dehydrogenase with different specificities n=2 Tax=Legionella oakridgensis TaxID=29423 RepID=W0BJ72_9GAMM|nr:pteridine reductase [Legionella oakridgensis]AHE68464.1 dehydrogenase with different specificities [Legionella oakridgensis ATCC 33761 = DSM 21215]KTD38383.1 pteridine reductase [Legionella oakridgensis]STY21400.1 pteridine reductase 1 [Legionella longbeachae]